MSEQPIEPATGREAYPESDPIENASVGPKPAGGPENIDADDEKPPPPFAGDDDLAAGHLGEQPG